MLAYIKSWYKKYIAEPESAVLAVLLLTGTGFIYLTSHLLSPLFTAIIIAYLLQTVVNILKSYGISHSISVTAVFSAFLGLFLIALLILLPLLWNQFLALFQEMPAMLHKAQEAIYIQQESLPDFISRESIDAFLETIVNSVKEQGTHLIAVSIASIPNMLVYGIYLVLVPLIVFFLLKDSRELLVYSKGFLPKKSSTINKIWSEVDRQIGNYIRGKVVEALVVGLATAIGLLYFNTPYTFLLSLIVALSVLVPYVGFVIVTVPVVFVGLSHLGLTSDFFYYALVYSIIQLLDANLLVPILFSNAVSLHPVSIIVAVLFFGGLWGILGVFFAIPLAVFVKAVFTAWPSVNRH